MSEVYVLPVDPGATANQHRRMDVLALRRRLEAHLAEGKTEITFDVENLLAAARRWEVELTRGTFA